METRERLDVRREAPAAAGRLLVVSNRLPVVLSPAAGGGWELRPAAGGLVSAVTPILERRGGAWLGWPGSADAGPGPSVRARLDAITGDLAYSLLPVALTREEVDGFYYGFSNRVLWPLFHGFRAYCEFDAAHWRIYQRVNRRFAAEIARAARRGDLVWIHDYHLMGVGRELRRMGYGGRTGFFLHIPFPPPDLYSRLPWGDEILRAVLHYDVVGFQTLPDLRRCLRCLRRWDAGLTVERHGGLFRVQSAHGTSLLGAFPIGIDFERYAEGASAAPVRARATALRRSAGERTILLGLDRLDYTKGVPERMEAYAEALGRFPALRDRVTLIQVVVPSREGLPRYRRVRDRIERRVRRVNATFGLPGWTPIRYSYRSLTPEDLLAHYRAAAVALVTPLRDGMNLVAKEYCAARADGLGTLVLSRFAGAAKQLGPEALLVNPREAGGTAGAIRRAVEMPTEERRRRMGTLRRRIRRDDVFRWAGSFLGTLAREGRPHAAGSGRLGAAGRSE